MSREGVEARIDDYDPAPFHSERIGEFEGYDLVRHRDRVYGVPQELGPVDLNVEEERTGDGVACGATVEEVIGPTAPRAARSRSSSSAGCRCSSGSATVARTRSSPHTEEPPPGYRFVRTGRVALDGGPYLPGRLGRAWDALYSFGLSLWVFVDTARRHGTLRTLRTLYLFLSLVAALARKVGFMPALRFAHSRNFRSQVLAPPHAELTFVTSVPYTYGQNPWVIEVEDPTTLFYPFLRNGETVGVDLAAPRRTSLWSRRCWKRTTAAASSRTCARPRRCYRRSSERGHCAGRCRTRRWACRCRRSARSTRTTAGRST